jgi:outer membrane protein assembly factor BamB
MTNFQRIGSCKVFAGCLFWLAIDACMVVPEVRAQWPQGRFSPSEGILLKAPREVESLLEDAQGSIARKQWSEATLALGMLLGIEEAGNEESGEDYFLVREAGDNVTVDGTVLRRAHAMLSSLPEEGQKVIELRYGVQASQGLEEAVQQGRWNQVRELAGRYAFTRAGQDANIILAERALSDGESRRAALLLERLLLMDSATKRYGAGLGLMTVAAFQAAGMEEDAKRALAATRAKFNSVTLDWNGAKIDWNDKSTEAEILEKLKGEGLASFPRVVTHPPVPGGDSTRNADTRGGLPLPILSWLVQLHESSQHKDNLDRTLKKLVGERKWNLIPSRIPIAVGPLIITPTYDRRILAIDSRSGRIVWACVFSGTPLGFSLDRFAGKDGFSLGQPAPDYLLRRVWGETAEGQVSTDGRLLFSLSEVPAVDVGESFAQGPNARLAKNLGIKSYNVLQAWSIPDQGKLVWEVGGQSGLNSPELAGALFLGTPLPYEGELLCIAEINGEIFLLGLESETGRLKWRQPIAANSGTTLSVDPQRRSFGATPAVDGSIAVCPTLSGYLVAYDLASRELLWQFKYPVNASQVPGAAFNFIGNMEMRGADPLLARSVDNSVLLHEGVAIFAPPNGGAVFGVSLSDGSELWQVGFDDPTPLRYVAAATGKIVAIVQSNALMGVDVRSGQRAWPNIPFPGDSQAVGRGVRSGNRYFLPLSNQSILEIDLIEGKIVGETKAEKPLGNLVAVGDRLLSASPFQLDCYMVLDAFQKRLLEEIKTDGETVNTLLQRGEIAMAGGDLDESLTCLEKAYSLSPENAEVRLSLLKVAMMALKSNFDRYADRVQQYHDLAQILDVPSYLRIMIHGLERQERWEEMFVKLLEYSDVRLGHRIDQMSDGEDIDVNALWTVQEDRWIATRLERCAEKMSAEAWARIAPMVAARTSIPLKDFGLRRLRLEHFQGIDGIEEERLAMASMMGRSQLIDTERILQFRRSPDEKLGPSRLEALIHLYLAAGRVGIALEVAAGNLERVRSALKELAGEAPFSIRSGIDTPELERAVELFETRHKNHVWPQGNLQVWTEFGREGGRDLGRPGDTSTLCPIVEVVGDSFRDWQVYFGSGYLQYVHRVTGDTYQQLIDVGTSETGVVPRLYAVDSMLLIELKNQLVAIDTLKAYMIPQDGLLWRTSYLDETVDPQERVRPRASTIVRDDWGLPTQKRAFKVAAVSRRGVVVQSNEDLTCLDLLTGIRLWTVTGFRNASFIRQGETLYVYKPGQKSSGEKSNTAGSEGESNGTSKIVAVDLRDGMILSSKETELKNWDVLATMGGKFLLSPVVPKSEERAARMKLRLLDPVSATVVLSREHTTDTRLAFVGDTGVLAMRPNGTMQYWNVRKGTEFEYEIDVEGKFGMVSAPVFGDIALVLPHAGSMELEKVAVFPSQRQDPTVVSCAGRMFAISVEDGKPIWERSQRVRQFAFPLSQNRESPVAVFIRQLTLSKVKGVDIDFTSLAMVDVKTGRLLYQKHDLPAMRGRGFRQVLNPGENSMMLQYLGNTIHVEWTDDKEGLPPVDEVDEVGELDVVEFRKMAESLVDEIQSRLDPSGRLKNAPEIDEPK